MSEKKIFFLNDRKQRLCGILTTHPSSPLVVVICHGLMCHKNSDILLQLAESISKSFNVFRFDFASSGASASESEGQFSFAAYEDDVSDLSAAVEFLKTQTRLDLHALVGHSKGSNVVLLYATANPENIPRVLGISGRRNMNVINQSYPLSEFEQSELTNKGEIMWRGKWRMTLEAYQARERIDMSIVSNIRSRVIIIHGSNDRVIPFADAEELLKIIPNSELHVIPGASHFFETDSDRTLLSATVMSSLAVAPSTL
jgi:pimeloyl-ACP methyl ester carboxylesterase